MMAGHPPTQHLRKLEEAEAVEFLTTPLHIAALQGDHRAVERFLTAGKFVDAPDQDMQTPLLMACECEPSGRCKANYPKSRRPVLPCSSIFLGQARDGTTSVLLNLSMQEEHSAAQAESPGCSMQMDSYSVSRYCWRQARTLTVLQTVEGPL